MSSRRAVYIALTKTSDAGVELTRLDDEGAPVAGPDRYAADNWRRVVGEWERERPRWVWADTSTVYPLLLRSGVRIERCVDLRLSHVILRNSALSAASELARGDTSAWDTPAPGATPTPRNTGDSPSFALFDLDEQPEPRTSVPGSESEAVPDPVAEFALQRRAIAGSGDPGRLALLIAAESAGALIASEMQFAGLPWRADVHDRLLAELLGPRPPAGQRPDRLRELVLRLQDVLETPELNPDSAASVLKALQRVGLIATSTRSGELKKLDHAAIAPLLEYKKLARLLSANGWHWLDTWVDGGRFRPAYVPGGVVTGRWASDGGGALQLPRQVRGAVIADAGWKLIVADASQLEPRILAAMSGDLAMARAGRGGDLYAGIVASGVVETREHAKVGMLGAMYGGTTGASGRVLPRLSRAYPKAIGFVENAARAGERGEIVTTRLGRSSPRPGTAWRDLQGEAYGEDASDADARRARSSARGWGRFTRNFVVQGTAAEWALCWMAGLRGRLWSMGSAPGLIEHPHLVFFLHDEVIVHSPAHLAEAVASEIRQAAAEAGRLIFGDMPVDFPVTVAIVDSYAEAK